MTRGPRYSRRHRNRRPQGSRGPREPRNTPIPTSGPTEPVAGVVELAEGGNGGGYLRQAAHNYLPHRDDIVVPAALVRTTGLRVGSEVEGLARDGGGRRTLVEIEKANGLAVDDSRDLPHFQDLVSVNPHEAFRLSGEQAEISLRVIDLIAPIGRGQRGLIVSPPKAGKTTLLEQLGQAIAKHQNNLPGDSRACRR